MRRPMLKLCSIVAVVGLVAIGCGSDKKKTTTETTAGSSSGTTAAGGGKSASELTKNDTLTGAKGTGKTRGIIDSAIKIGCEFTQAQFTGADDGYKARFE